MPDVFGKKKIKDLETKIGVLQYKIEYISDELDRVYKDMYGRSKQISGLSGSVNYTFTPVWENKKEKIKKITSCGGSSDGSQFEHGIYDHERYGYDY